MDLSTALSNSTVDFPVALHYVYSASYPEVLACANGVGCIPRRGKSWHDVGLIASYKPMPEEIDSKFFERVPYFLVPIFSQYDLERRRSQHDEGEETEFAFSPICARTWFSVLCDRVQEVLRRCDDITKEVVEKLQPDSFDGISSPNPASIRPSANLISALAQALTELSGVFNLKTVQTLLGFQSLHSWMATNARFVDPRLSDHFKALRQREYQEPMSRADYQVLGER